MFERCQVLTPGQRARLAAAGFVLGAAAAIGAGAFIAHRFPAPVVPLEPRVEHSDQRFGVVRLRFAHRGVEVACRFITYRESDTWTVECPQENAR